MPAERLPMRKVRDVLRLATLPHQASPPSPLIVSTRASTFPPFEALALFDARPGWDLLKTALNSDLQPRDGRAAAGAFVRALRR